jgi:flavorubredoxin
MVIKTEAYLSKKELANAQIGNLRTYFEPKDIKYVIIRHDSEISEFINVVRESKGTKYTHSDVEHLMTRIITVDQITDDF